METRIDFLTAAAPDAPAQLAQLLALEWLLGVGMPDKLKEAPLAIKVLYDEDIAEEVCLNDEPLGRSQCCDWFEGIGAWLRVKAILLLWGRQKLCSRVVLKVNGDAGYGIFIHYTDGYMTLDPRFYEVSADIKDCS